ncbi:hypothetical protein PROFUN_12231 [Planoprotostelium fungivorum]|uniref:Uncharacterized protein n=1 Tax=Planoprotostelium fungivorum TaxID=1890364 RepID=A0A2P6N871_9EUKA|nr:hypothetical protein PROFUN_12231 [Planoprotostelium fungivorum]
MRCAQRLDFRLFKEMIGGAIIGMFRDLEGEDDSLTNHNSVDSTDFKSDYNHLKYTPAVVTSQLPPESNSSVLPPESAPLDGGEEWSCSSCGNTTFQTACDSCGLITESRNIATDAEYRVFSDDSESKNKIRVGSAYNPLMEYSLTEKSRLERDEKEFLWDGLKNVDEIFYKLYNGDCNNTASQHRARELFQKAFHIQVNQKQGIGAPMKRTGGDNKRQKFSRRKQFVVACIWAALRENHIKTWGINELSNLLEGIQVSKYSVKNCLKDLEETCVAFKSFEGTYLVTEGEGIFARNVPIENGNVVESIPNKAWFYLEAQEVTAPPPAFGMMTVYKLRTQFNKWVTVDEDNRLYTNMKKDYEYVIEYAKEDRKEQRIAIKAGKMYIGVRNGNVGLYSQLSNNELFWEVKKSVTPGVPLD